MKKFALLALLGAAAAGAAAVCVKVIKDRKSNLDATGKDPECFREVVLNSWIARGMEVALIALLVTARRLRMKGA